MKEEPETTAQIQPTRIDLAAWRWPIVVLALGLMGLVAYLRTVDHAKASLSTVKTATDAVREINETAQELTEAAVTIAEEFQHGKITETFVGSLPKVEDAGEGRLEVATMENTKTIKRTDRLTILWNAVSLGTTTTELKVPATYRYHVRLADPWTLEVREQGCLVIAPALRATTPVAIHTGKLVKRSDEGWARFNGNEEMASLEKSLTRRLNRYATSPEHLSVVREPARRSVALFVRKWLLEEEHWRKDRFRTIHVIFADEAKPSDYPAKPTLELN